ncbi:hypothetical protein ADU85_01470 [Clostridium botulinum]|nr:hypothetical protein Y848_06430 [Clostridium botulinum C/D str. Sp77]KOA76866.1 hypothetical protein ADU78_05255 [Clostridium botulinum]KOA80945.1 hypothetical protein ADU77_00180 [Clostridium botulinum]KOA88971.1 hypothetical protein ADU75_00910 [Clostridium botulinum]KOC31840.1 hypothetical protein ADU83_11980 [Clostridium botulinum]
MKISKKVRQIRDKLGTKQWKKTKHYNKLMLLCQRWQSIRKQNKRSHPFHFFKVLNYKVRCFFYWEKR